MSKVSEAFAHGKAFIPFLTAGDPDADSTVRYVLEMVRAGADLIEIGIPFSDPTAEGPVIYDADIRAIAGGMTVEGVFDIVRRVREQSQVPICLMTYLNPVFYYGYETFTSRCETLGVDGIIVPDLPFEEKHELSDIAAQHGVDVISLIAPTSNDRIRMIAREATGFIYLVSSMGVTGVRSEITTDLKSIVSAVRSVTDIPCAIGFGISTPAQAREMAGTADGAIVGSAVVKIIEQYGDKAADEIYQYVSSMKAAVKS